MVGVNTALEGLAATNHDAHVSRYACGLDVVASGRYS
jgi:hypothetical protein